jgi:DNA-binding transcriptional LysR family regulator
MLSFKHEVFFEVARLKSFTKASQTLFISQPAISRNIKQLEDEYKSSLFERKGNSISLTEAGQMLYAALLNARAVEKQLQYDMSTLRDQYEAKGELKLGASTTVALYIIPPILSGFRQKHQSVSISLFNRNSESVLQALLDHEIDLGIIEGRNKLPIVKSQHFLADEVIAVCSPKNPLSKKQKLNLKEVTKHPIALRERGSGTLAALKHALSTHRIKLSDLSVNVRLGGTEALKNFIVADQCIGFLPMRSVVKELSSGDLVQLKIDKLSIIRRFYFIQRHGDEGNGLCNAFIKFSKAHYNIK